MADWTTPSNPTNTYSETDYFRKRYGDHPILNGTVQYGGSLTTNTYQTVSGPSAPSYSDVSAPSTSWS